MKRNQRWLQLIGLSQIVIVLYGVGAALGQIEMWYPLVPVGSALFLLFWRLSKKGRFLWETQWARIDDVLKEAKGAVFSFRNREYAKLFRECNVQREYMTD